MNYKVNILSTRPLSPSVLEEAQQNDVHIDIISFIHTEAITSNELQQEIAGLLSKKIVAVFTSMNAVEAVNDHANGNKPSWKIFCIGNATATLARKYFGSAAIAGTGAGTAQNASALAEVIIEENIKEVVFFCGDQRRDELPNKLTACNIPVNEITVYRTVATPQKIQKNYNGILFFSPSAAESFFSVNTISPYTVLFAIGNTTGNTIRKFTSNGRRFG